MKIARRFAASCIVLLALAVPAAVQADTADAPFKPVVGQHGRDVVWVPTPPILVEKMLDMARVTPDDFVMDLGSGDGRNIIAAAKRGARGLGVEYNSDMVALSNHIAEKEGVADLAHFVQGDMYEADISEATVLALFLLPENLNKLVPKFLDLKPGTRIVANYFGVDGWEPDVTDRVDGDCQSWCTALMYIVPAKVAGKWRHTHGELTLEQKFQMVSGTLLRDGRSVPVKGRLLGERITFTAGGQSYTGIVNAGVMTGDPKASPGPWKAVRADD